MSAIDTPASGRDVDKSRTTRARRTRLDLRRRPDSRLNDTLLDRAVWLDPADRTLVELVFREGRTLREIAALLDERPRAVQRRLRRLAERLLDPLTAFVAVHAPGWPATRQRVAVACVIEGRSMREAAQRLDLSLHTVRRHLAVVRELAAEARRAQAARAVPGRWAEGAR